MEINASSKKIIEEFLAEWWQTLNWQASQTVVGAELPHMTPEQLYDQLLGQNLREIAAAAEGLVERNEASADETLAAVQELCEWMFARPGLPSAYHIPEDWWASPMGNLALRAHLWAGGDELITLSQAVEISGKSVSSLSQMISRRKIAGYPDPNEPNPQRRTRVLRREIEALKKR